MDNMEQKEKGEATYFNEYDQELLEKGVPKDLRVSASKEVHSKKPGYNMWIDEIPYPPEKAAKHIGEYNMNNGVIIFVDRNGNAWSGGDGPKQRKALERAGYQQNSEMSVPFSNGELLSEHVSTFGERQQDKWERIKSLAQRDWEEERAQTHKAA